MVMAKSKLQKVIKQHFYFLYNIFFIIGLFYCALNSTMILHNQHTIQSLIKMMFFIGLLFMLYKIFYIDNKQYHEKLVNTESIIIFLTIAFVFLCGHLARTSDIAYFLIYVIASKNISLRTITKNIIIVLTSILILAIFLSSIGLVKNLIVSRTENTIRYANGFNYTTIYSAYIFMLNIAISVYNIINVYKDDYISFKKKWATLFLILLLTILSYVQTNTRTDLICNIILIITLFSYFFLFKKSHFNYIIQNIFKCFMLLMPLLIALFTIISAILYNVNSKIWQQLNNIFSGRLFLVHDAFLKYPPKLIGQYFKQIGNGSKTKLSLNETYFYIDNSFARVWFMLGIIIFIALIYVMFIAILNMLNTNNHTILYLAIIIIISSLEGISADNMLLLVNTSLFITYIGFTNNFQSLKRSKVS